MQSEVIAQSAQVIYQAFVDYNATFAQVTFRARHRFEQRDWHGHQQDIVHRVEIYQDYVQAAVTTVHKLLGPRVKDRELWKNVRDYFGQRLENMPDVGFRKTFFNSVTRRIFGTVGVDAEIEFVATPVDDDSILHALSLQRYPYWGSLADVFDSLLDHFEFSVPYVDKRRDVDYIVREVEGFARRVFEGLDGFLRFEFISSVFYQSARAYLVGRIVMLGGVSPLVIAFENTDDGIKVDAVLLASEEVSIIFSYTRSYYFADPNSVVAAVHFIHTMLPDKPLDELYTVLGRLRQGKTERFRIFSNHMQASDDHFVHAAGDKGLVMLVFTLPSYDLVFKVIRDRFGPPKTISRQDVIDKYVLVSKHDRGGRLIDTQEFRNLQLPLNRFAPELLQELREEASDTVTVQGDDLILDHVYIERRVRPLNLYLREAGVQDAELAIIDYGQAIKDLAQTNIFPGDLLLKNFGVTKHRRVVFYDYDEVVLVTECRFRDLPEPLDEDDMMRVDDWCYVDSADIFPQEFIKFLAMDAPLRELFMEVHGDLLTAEYWRDIQARHKSGDISLVVPYFQPPMPRGRIFDRRALTRPVKLN